uniref:PI3K/PI4K domain-containing protein n=1 Tax=Schistocephalus solidus TaxID=70667 RepID=A0A183T5B6_SCHSO
LGADSVEALFGSDARLQAEGNIAGSADLNRPISQSTANSRLPRYLLVQKTDRVNLCIHFLVTPFKLASPTLDNLDTFLRFCNPDDGLQVRLMIKNTFHEFRVLILWKLSSILMAFTDFESGAGLHAEGNIAGSVVRNRVIPQLTASSGSPSYLQLVQNT